MPKTTNHSPLAIQLIGLTCLSLIGTIGHAGAQNTGEKGARIYCFMRDAGNEHEVSWNASYAVIKRQTNSIFKTSPRHAAVMIIEAVVDNPENYNNCGNFLGDLFGTSQSREKIEAEQPSNNNRYSF